MSKKTEELQNFVDALRLCLGLSTLYRVESSYGGVQTITDPLGHSGTDDWFHSAEFNDSTRNQRWDNSIALRMKILANAECAPYRELTKRRASFRNMMSKIEELESR